MATFTPTKKRVSGHNITPGVIEPSFGVGRIIYAILEHAYYTRAGDEQRAVLALPPIIAPVKVSVLPLTQHAEVNAPLPRIIELLEDAAISFKVDDSGTSIGRRYARTDDIGIPFGITIDHQTPQDNTVTLRERDTQAQVRIKLDELVPVIQRLVDGRLKWDQVLQKYPRVEVKLDDD
jgi:glycyl-tRNA synthetase